jgi:hypothetical protein
VGGDDLPLEESMVSRVALSEAGVSGSVISMLACCS